MENFNLEFFGNRILNCNCSLLCVCVLMILIAQLFVQLEVVVS